MSDVSGYKPQQGGMRDSEREVNLTQQAKELGRDFKNKASGLTDSVARTAKEQAAELGTAAKELASDAAGKIQTAMNDQKSVGADYISNIAQAVHRAAGEFEGEVPQAARYIRKAAGQLDTVANAVRERDVRELFNEVQQFARRQPTAFFSGAVILGFAAIRFFKSSARNTADDMGGGEAYDETSPSLSPQATPSISPSARGQSYQSTRSVGGV
jgi:hypothetical protein